MLKNLIRTFIPWILYFSLIGPSQKQLDIAIIASLAAFLFFGAKELKKGFILTWGTFLFFIFMLVTVVLFKIQWIASHEWLFSNGTLASIAWISLLLGKPFTLQYAREQVSKEKWNHPIFIQINQLLTLTWGLIFLFCTIIPVIQIYYPYPHHLWIYETLSNGLAVFGIWFTVWFPSWYRKKMKGEAQ